MDKNDLFKENIGGGLYEKYGTNFAAMPDDALRWWQGELDRGNSDSVRLLNGTQLADLANEIKRRFDK